ncbi:hypothetical protein WR25_04586 [Diploscapter pachys]|uniref:MalT-like TPR region domain-containing protein n=1 Tax=Diploscapter pachys TaxID=2018661 RepID=A0A2A2LKZ1_9BILA|nr:hypothetical protein WR25_04586 [Diploscapter pachys]
MQSQSPNALEKLVSTAGTAYSEGKFEQALSCYKEALALQPSNAVLYANISAIHLRLGQFNEALGHAETAVSLSPHWAKAHYRKGEALKKLDNSIAAILSLSYAARLDPSHKNALDSLIHLAVTFFDGFPIQQLTALRLHDDRFTVLCAVGQKFLESDKNKEASEVLSHALCLQSDSLKLKGSAVSSLALAYCRLGQHEEALNYYLEELHICEQLGDQTLEVHDRIAVAAELAHRWQLAEKHRRTRINQLQGHELLNERIKLAEVLLQMKQSDEVISLLTDLDEDRLTKDEKRRRRMTIGLALCQKAYQLIYLSA